MNLSQKNCLNIISATGVSPRYLRADGEEIGQHPCMLFAPPSETLGVAFVLPRRDNRL